MSDNAISAHGTTIERQASPGGAFTTIGEVGDITPPGFTRNEIDVSNHNDDIDAYVAGILRRSTLQFPVNFIASDAEHAEATGMLKHMHDNTKTGYRITFPDGDKMIFSGYLVGMQPAAPVDGGYQWNISIRPSGPMYYNALLFD